MILSILRGLFLVLAASIAALYVLPYQEQGGLSFASVVVMMIGGVAIAAAIVALDISTQRKRLSAISGVFLGLVAGLLTAYALSFVVDLIGVLTAPSLPFNPPDTAAGFASLSDAERDILRDREAYLNLLRGVKVLIGLVTCYGAISLVLQTKDDFRFVLPYVEFSKQVRGLRPTLLDTSIIIDGRILDLVKTRIMQGPLVVPQFVLDELQRVADSADKVKRARGRRGLEVLQELREHPLAEVIIHDDSGAVGSGEDGVGEVDRRLIELAHELRGRLMTNDYNLEQVAGLRGIEVINLHTLAAALKAAMLPGERLEVDLIKPGETPTQGVGYLPDGTMIVVEDARPMIGQRVAAEVTRTLQTTAGQMIFAKYQAPRAEETLTETTTLQSSTTSAPFTPTPPEDSSGGNAPDPDPAPPSPTAPTPTSSDPPVPDRHTARHRRSSASARNPRRGR